jgi:rhodanese-related sulfurtransferase
MGMGGQPASRTTGPIGHALPNGIGAAQPDILKSWAYSKGVSVSFFIENWVLIAVAITSGAFLLWPLASAGGRAGSVDSAQAVQLMNRDKAVVVDVRDAAGFASGHVIGAKNIPLADLEAKLPGAVKNKALPVIMVCANGAAANRGVAIAKKLGYENAHALTGGMGAWRTANLPVEKA